MTGLDVSVVVAAHDPGPVLVETLASIAAQSRAVHEIVIVDDGSTDDSIAAALEQFARTGPSTRPPIRVLRQDRTGPAGARNLGAVHALGGALLFVDADDLLTDHAIALLCAPMERDPTVVMVHGATREFVDEHAPPTSTTRPPLTYSRPRLGGATLVRRSFWEQVGPLDVALGRGEWIDWMHRAHASGRPIVEIEDVVFERRMHAGNRTGSGQDFGAYVDVARAALARRRQSTPDQGSGTAGR